MIGPEKLSTIRQELRDALDATGDDPIAWLEKRVAASRRRGVPTSAGSEVLESLQRFLEAPVKKKRGRQRASTKSKQGP